MAQSLIKREIVDVVQGEPEWYEARRGIVTASHFSDVMAQGTGATRRKYMLRLAGERLTGEIAEAYSNAHMERGQEHEPKARAQYEFDTDCTVEQIGFIRYGERGASPDGFVGKDGMVEFKSALPDILIDTHLRRRYPPEHRPQLQGNLWIADRKWIDIVIYWPGLPLYRERVTRDEAYIREIEVAVHHFNKELADIVRQIEALS